LQTLKGKISIPQAPKWLLFIDNKGTEFHDEVKGDLQTICKQKCIKPGFME